jgi:DNA-binding response OmpR family regulator
LSAFAEVDLIVAPTAERGVELARTRRPDVIIMDITLPGMSGSAPIRRPSTPR